MSPTGAVALGTSALGMAAGALGAGAGIGEGCATAGLLSSLEQALAISMTAAPMIGSLGRRVR
jgi:hypothetical protein